MASPKPPYRVSFLPGCYAPVIGAATRMAKSGLTDSLQGLFQTIEITLSQVPRTWGDPQKNYPGMKAMKYVRHMVSDGIRVEYIVHNFEPVVIVRSISPIEGGPFDSDAPSS